MEPGAQGCSRGGVPGDGSGPGRLVLGRKQGDSLGGRSHWSSPGCLSRGSLSSFWAVAGDGRLSSFSSESRQAGALGRRLRTTVWSVFICIFSLSARWVRF